ncbi:flavin reductase [uncultured Neptuniibacter sp.]|uniref:flavin reductase n=1 Tax=uncultured Neptuniibacter sp. TaxID=502143 RepID=UPI00262862E6|nr:flavin reductase [uncultured Neptuniibacter sp.]
MSSDKFDIKDFRRALSQFPTGVTVITALDDSGEPVGVTASSFNSVSIDPPLILWSIDKGAYSLDTFRDTEFFAVNVLGRDQVSTSNNFASRGEDKFANASYSAGIGGAPVLDDYAAQFECKTWAVYEGGDHLILVGEVVDYRYNDGREPLVFARGSYAVSSTHPAMTKGQVDASSNEFVSDYLLYLLRETYNRYSQELYPRLMSEGGVTPEEWRVLAILADQPSKRLAELSPLVMQPESALRETADWMVGKGHVVLEGESVSLSENGQALAESLRSIAKQHEAEVISSLSEEQASMLKESLRTIIRA